MIFIYEYNGETYVVSIERQPDGSYRATIGDRVYMVQARQIQNGGWLFHLDNHRVAAYTAAQGDARYVNMLGRNYMLTVPNRRGSRRKVGPVGAASRGG